MEIFDRLNRDADGVYCDPQLADGQQKEESELRKKVAEQSYQNYLEEISFHHSVPVMDRQVRLFLQNIPKGGLVIDVGGCWAWHWRELDKLRPDVKVVVVDFIKENFAHARKIVGHLLDKQVFLVHSDATRLPFAPDLFDGYWTVQTLQHIPDFAKAIAEAKRVLKPGGQFWCYSLNDQPPIRWIYRLLRRPYVVKGYIDGFYFLERLSRSQIAIIEKIFGAPAHCRYSEILFKPELGLRRVGRQGFWGRLDALLSNSFFFSLWARQKSCHITRLDASRKLST